MKKLFCFVALTFCLFPIFSVTMSAKVNLVPESIRETIFKTPEETLPLLVKNLTGNSSSTAEKVKVLHDWICNNIAYNTDVFTGNPGKQDYVTVLKKKKAVCSGYTNLMNQMCALAGIESIGIEGYSKGFGYRGYIEDGQQCDHAWNAVKLGNKWQLIDVTWDAGFVDVKTFVKHYSTEWLYLTPEQFSFSHLPKDEANQFLAKPKSIETFVKEPYVRGAFFQYGLSLGEKMPDYRNEISQAVEYEFKLTKANVAVMSDILSETSKEFVENGTWTDRIGSKIAVNFDVPDASEYTGRILARQSGEVENPVFFSIQEFEGSVIPRAQQALAEKKITQVEFEHLEKSYTKVAENGRYYIAENLFATARNNAVTKILKMQDANTGNYNEVLSFKLTAASDYSGYGTEIVRFPSVYATYSESKNTHLISPICGVLKKNETYHFAVKSGDFTSFGIVQNNAIVPFSKNASSGTFEIEFTVSEDAETVPVFGSKNGRNFSGLFFYTVE